MAAQDSDTGGTEEAENPAIGPILEVVGTAKDDEVLTARAGPD